MVQKKKKQHKRQGPESGPEVKIERPEERLVEHVLEGLKEVVRSEPIVEGPDCLKDEVLLDYLERELSSEHADKIIEHLYACCRCREEAADLAKDLKSMG